MTGRGYSPLWLEEMTVLTGVMTSSSRLALTRALSPATPWAPEPALAFQDLFLGCHHGPEPSRPFCLLDNLSRIPTKCYYCDGSGKCQQDYPRAGSGKDGSGEKEYYCGGSGRCVKCDGSGWIYPRLKMTIH